MYKSNEMLKKIIKREKNFPNFCIKEFIKQLNDINNQK